MVILPIALRASPSTAHEPTPPTPITQTWACLKDVSADSPYKRAMPPNRRSKSIASESGGINGSTVAIPTF